jgi:hypothetical protein
MDGINSGIACTYVQYKIEIASYHLCSGIADDLFQKYRPFLREFISCGG